MKLVIERRYHLSSDGPGDAPADISPNRIRDLMGMLGIPDEKCSGPERRAVIAMREGFTAEQFRAFQRIARRVIEEKRAYHTGQDNVISKAVLGELPGIERMLDEIVDNINLGMAEPITIYADGMRENAADRREAAKEQES